MKLIEGVTKVENSDYVLYFVEYLSDELKAVIRNELSDISHGGKCANSSAKTYSYRETVKGFIKRYKSKNDSSEERKKGMIGELLVHIILQIENRFLIASSFFNLEEKSFKKGFDVTLYETSTKELWIAEVKSGGVQQKQKDCSSATVGLIDTAKRDLKRRLNENDENIWLNAINAAIISMTDSDTHKKAVIKLLEHCSDGAVDCTNKSNMFNVVLSTVLFHPLDSDRMKEEQINQKYKKVVNEGLFNKVSIISIQQDTYKSLYNFLESEAENE